MTKQTGKSANCRASIPWNTTQQLKEPVDTDNNPGKSPENYVEWKKKILKGGILYGSIYVSFLK